MMISLLIIACRPLTLGFGRSQVDKVTTFPYRNNQTKLILLTNSESWEWKLLPFISRNISDYFKYSPSTHLLNLNFLLCMHGFSLTPVPSNFSIRSFGVFKQNIASSKSWFSIILPKCMTDSFPEYNLTVIPRDAPLHSCCQWCFEMFASFL